METRKSMFAVDHSIVAPEILSINVHNMLDEDVAAIHAQLQTQRPY